jgi:ceramide glucosyltransferase
MAISIILQVVLLVATLAGIFYYLLCLMAAFSFFHQPAAKPPILYPPVSVLVPLCGEDAQAYANFSSLCTQEYPDYQIVFGVRDSLDPVIKVIRKLELDFPDRDIQLVISDDTIGENPKVNNLQNILIQAKHEHIVIVDSDIRVRKDYLSNVVPWLDDLRIGLVTCPYRSLLTPNLSSRLEALGISAEFMPGVMVSRLIEGVRFALGATMATTRQRLQLIGGLGKIANHLADDYMLGYLMSEAAFQIHLAPYVVDTVQPASSLVNMLKHQIRLSRGIRSCRPLGYLGLIVTYGTILSFFYCLVSRFSSGSLVLLAISLALRGTVGRVIGGCWMKDNVVRTHFWLLPMRDIFGFLVWSCGLFGRKVEWRGEVFELIKGGNIVRRAGRH